MLRRRPLTRISLEGPGGPHVYDRAKYTSQYRHETLSLDMHLALIIKLITHVSTQRDV
jgi:hypothetical protein